MANDYDVLVLGTGNAGMAAARVTREAGRSVAIVECREDVGGTCALRGCVPKKVLVAAAETMEAIRSAGRHAITVSGARLDWAKLIEREKSIIAGTPDSFMKTLAQRGIPLLRGQARFVGTNEVDIAGQRISAAHVVIATGSMPRPLPFDGSDLLIDNEVILSDPHLPESVIFIGGGVIGMEFAHVYARAGSKVTILEASPRILPAADPSAASRLHDASAKIGVTIMTDVNVEAVTRDDRGFIVRFSKDGESHTLQAARVAHGAGRVPAVEALDLDAARIQHDGPKIAVTEHLASVSNAAIYVAGDALSQSAQLSPLASHEGDVVGRNIVEGNTAVPDYLPVPSVVYTIPPLASVGLTQKAAETEGIDVDVRENDMSDWLSTELYGNGAAYSKVLIERVTRRIVGAHLVGERTDEAIHLFALAMKFGITADDLAAFVYAFPTYSSNVKSLV